MIYTIFGKRYYNLANIGINMKIFFGVSPRAIVDQGAEFRKIYNWIEKLGHTNLNNIPINANPSTFYDIEQSDIESMYDDLIRKCKQAEVLIVEASIHSLTMGYYIKLALDLDKPVIILHRIGERPFFFSGIQNDLLQILEYSPESIPEILEEGINFAKDKINIRFNMFLSPELNNYLKWAANRSGTQRSSFFRSLLMEHKDKHEQEYQASLKD